MRDTEMRTKLSRPLPPPPPPDDLMKSAEFDVGPGWGGIFEALAWLILVGTALVLEWRAGWFS